MSDWSGGRTRAVSADALHVDLPPAENLFCRCCCPTQNSALNCSETSCFVTKKKFKEGAGLFLWV